jgi:formylglycine-generating enzyme required for sulfatase activity
VTSRLFPIALIGLLLTLVLAGGAAVAQGQLPTDDPAQGSSQSLYLPAVSGGTGTALVMPHATNRQDSSWLSRPGGPASWMTNFGDMPQIVVASSGSELDVLAQDYAGETAWNAVLLHIAPSPGGYTVTQALTALPMLDRVMGLAVDGSGNRYYATGVDEDYRVDSSYPPLNTYRSDIVRVVKVNGAGEVQFNIDLDPARHDFDQNAEMIINPMAAATARLAVGGNEVALVHGINTAPDPNIGGARHQKALSTRLDATTGAILRTNSIWVSHSFDQRLLYDGEGILEYHLGDGYPRAIVLARDHRGCILFHIKGAHGVNLTATRLGNVALIENDADYGYLALFATENSDTLANFGLINGPRNLAVVRISRNDCSLDPALPDTLTVVSLGVQQTNRLKWLTNYTAESKLHAERPKLVGIGNDRYVVLWERWQVQDFGEQFQGVYGMVIDAQGSVLRNPTLLTDQHHLPRGDDAFFLDGRAGWLTGDPGNVALNLHLTDAELNYAISTISMRIPGATPPTLNTAEEILIPAGSFQMGCDSRNPAETCYSDEQPLHTVNLSAYYIDKYEVTNARYKACVDAGGCTAPESVNSSIRSPYYGTSIYADYPVLHVTWNQASTFCAWTGKRLPTEAEWEKAARGSIDTRKYPWGDSAPNCTKSNHKALCVGDTSRVGSYSSGASPYGVMDMSGNVREWVNDWYDENYYSVSPTTNPQGPATGTFRVQRDGSGNDNGKALRSAHRGDSFPIYFGELGGFRCARLP